MTRHCRSLGLALAVSFLISTTAVQSAWGEEPVFTADSYPALLGTTETEENTFTMAGVSFTCNDEAATYTGELVSPSSSLTIEPKYKSCTVASGNLRLTVVMNGCHYELSLETWNHEHSATGDIGLVCPEEEEQEATFNFYAASDISHIFPLFQYHLPAQHFEEVTYTVETGEGESTDALSLSGEATGTRASSTGMWFGDSLGEQTVETARLHLRLTITATDETEEHNGLRISTAE